MTITAPAGRMRGWRRAAAAWPAFDVSSWAAYDSDNMWYRVVVPFLALMLFSCATKSRGAAEAAAPPTRIKDSPPEKRAALRNADPKTDSEADEQRWGIEAASERQRQAEERNRAKQQAAGPQAPLPTGPFDIRAKSQTPPGAPAANKTQSP